MPGMSRSLASSVCGRSAARPVAMSGAIARMMKSATIDLRYHSRTSFTLSSTELARPMPVLTATNTTMIVSVERE